MVTAGKFIYMKHLFIIIGLLAGGLALPGCNNSGQATQTEIATENAAATDSTQMLAYVCPMGCEGSGSNIPGKCKVCDMDLIKNVNYQVPHDSAAHQ